MSTVRIFCPPQRVLARYVAFAILYFAIVLIASTAHLLHLLLDSRNIDTHHLVNLGGMIGAAIPIIIVATSNPPACLPLIEARNLQSDAVVAEIQHYIRETFRGQGIYKYGSDISKSEGKIRFFPSYGPRTPLIKFPRDGFLFKYHFDPALSYVYIESKNGSFRLVGPWRLIKTFEGLNRRFRLTQR